MVCRELQTQDRRGDVRDRRTGNRWKRYVPSIGFLLGNGRQLHYRGRSESRVVFREQSGTAPFLDTIETSGGRGANRIQGPKRLEEPRNRGRGLCQASWT